MSEQLRRDSPFSYQCNACCRCCHDKLIAVNPYEIARLAKAEGLSTTQFIETYLEEETHYLKRMENGACVFLRETSCSVHADRPLVCRLYPLGRQVEPDGKDSFFETPPHPETAGVYGQSGTAGSYLESQDAESFMLAADKYHSAVNELTAMLHQSDADMAQDEATKWLDLDDALQNKDAAAENLLTLVDLHIEELRRLTVDALKKGKGDGKGE